MVYGVGVYTEKGRCWPFWEQYLHCQKEAELPDIDCVPQYDDYIECLKRTKERDRMIEIIRRLRAKEREDASINNK